jgi:hypothetical protein
MAEEAPKEEATLISGLTQICGAFQDSSRSPDPQEVAEGLVAVVANLPESVLEAATVKELDEFLNDFTGAAAGYITGRQMNAVTSRICAVIEKKEATNKL